MILFSFNFVLPSAELISTMVQQCIGPEIGKPGVVLLYREYVIVSWPNLQKNILHIRRLVEWSNSKCRALPENDHRQPHGICLNSLSGQLEVCICLQKWACGDLLGQPFLHLEEFCFKRFISFTFWFKAGFIFSKSLVEEVGQTKLPQNE